MILRQIPNFNIRQIAESGQCFRIVQEPAGSQNLRPKARPGGRAKFPLRDRTRLRPAGYRLAYDQRFPLSAALENENGVYFFCPEEEFPFWENYLILPRITGSSFPLFKAAIHTKKGRRIRSGIRILRQDLWEMIITFVISPAKNHPGHPLPGGSAGKDLRSKARNSKGMPGASVFLRLQGLGAAASFTLSQRPKSCRASLSELQSMKLGYRAKYIKRLCEDACSGALDLAHLSVWAIRKPWTISKAFTVSAKKWPTVSACSAFIISAPSPWIPDPEDPAAGIRAQKPLRGVGSPDPPLPGAGSRKLFLL